MAKPLPERDPFCLLGVCACGAAAECGGSRCRSWKYGVSCCCCCCGPPPPLGAALRGCALPLPSPSPSPHPLTPITVGGFFGMCLCVSVRVRVRARACACSCACVCACPGARYHSGGVRAPGNPSRIQLQGTIPIWRNSDLRLTRTSESGNVVLNRINVDLRRRNAGLGIHHGNQTPFRLRSRTEKLRSGTEFRIAAKTKLRSGFVPERRNSVLGRSKLRSGTESQIAAKSNSVPASILTRATPAWDGNARHRGDRTESEGTSFWAGVSGTGMWFGDRTESEGTSFWAGVSGNRKIEPRPCFVPERRAELARSGSPDRCLTSQHRVRWDEGCA